jgi:hypothetical protein
VLLTLLLVYLGEPALCLLDYGVTSGLVPLDLTLVKTLLF